MFQREINGYNRAEVDSYIQRLKSSYEARLMAEKLKALESEKKVLDAKNERIELENKEKNIMNALDVIEKQQQFQEEGSKKIYYLVMEKLELLLDELNLKFPALKQNANFQNILLEFSKIISNAKENLQKNTVVTRISSGNDSMRALLSKMQEYKKIQESPKKVLQIKTQAPKQKQPESSKKATHSPEPTESFSFEEALHPTEDLEEIMKAFDFYNQ